MTVKKKRVRIGYCFAKVLYFFSERKYTNITDPLTFPLLGEKNSGRCKSVGFLEDGEGEGDSAKSEMMVASSVKLRLRGGEVL